MVGLVIVSHSEVLADGIVRLAREMAAPDLKIEPAGGIGEPDVLGTDASRVMVAIEQAMSPDGVLVLMDLGSALMSAELAVELVSDPPGPIRLSSAPLAEGAVAAAVAASSGATLDEVADEARGALAMKAAQISDGPGGDDTGGSGQAPEPTVRESGASGVVGGRIITSSEAMMTNTRIAAEDPTTSPDDVTLTVALPVRNAIGLHARPAARFVEVLRGLEATVNVSKEGSAAPPVKATSLTNLVALGARQGDVLLVRASGADAERAVERLRELAETGFGDGIDPGPQAGDTTTPAGDIAAGSGDREPAPSVVEPTAPPPPGTVISGVAVNAGLVVGAAHRLGGGPLAAPDARPVATVDAEMALLDEAVAHARTAIEHDREVVRERAGATDAEIFDAHLALLDDAAVQDPARSAIADGTAADAAWYQAVQQVATVYRGLADPLLAERATDVEDVGRRVLTALAHTTADGTGANGDAGANADVGADARAEPHGIVIADELTPADTAGLDPDSVTGIATARGSTTAHAAILARSLGIPAVLGLGAAILGVEDGTELLLDGAAGTVVVAPSPAEAAAARDARTRQLERAAHAQARAHEPGQLSDGTRIEVFANVGAVADAERAVAAGAEGVGLLRTEFLFLGRPDLPDEDEQTQMLTAIGAALDGRPLVVRTLDVGADKPLPALPMPAEENPFLGVRGLRLGLDRPELLLTQYRAVFRAAAEYPLKVMMPMVATVAEITAARELFEQARAQTGVSANVEFGIMVEVPGAAIAAQRLAPHVDFFSLGTNDLTQYTMAAERGNAALAPLLESPQPTVLRLIKATVDGGAAHGCWTGVCGEMAGDPATAVLLAGLGVRELSMSAPLVPEVKQALREVDITQARAAAAAALDRDDPASARQEALALLSHSS